MKAAGMPQQLVAARADDEAPDPGIGSVDREEIFVVLTGGAVATLGAERIALAAGDTLIVPAHTPFALGNPHLEPCAVIAMLPVGGRAAMPGGAPFVPPWAA